MWLPAYFQVKHSSSTRTMAATMEAPSAPSASQTYPTPAARETAFTENLTPELVCTLIGSCSLSTLSAFVCSTYLDTSPTMMQPTRSTACVGEAGSLCVHAPQHLYTPGVVKVACAEGGC